MCNKCIEKRAAKWLRAGIADMFWCPRLYGAVSSWCFLFFIFFLCLRHTLGVGLGGGQVGLITTLLLRTISSCYVTRTSPDFMLRYAAFSCTSYTTSSYAKISPS